MMSGKNDPTVRGNRSAFEMFRRLDQSTPSKTEPKTLAKTEPLPKAKTEPEPSDVHETSTPRFDGPRTPLRPTPSSSGPVTKGTVLGLRMSELSSSAPKTPVETAPVTTTGVAPSTLATVPGLTPEAMQEKFKATGPGFFATTITSKGYKFEGCDLHLTDIKESREGGKLYAVPGRGAKRVTNVRADVAQNLFQLDGRLRGMATLKDVDASWRNVVDASPTDISSNQGFSGDKTTSASREKAEVLSMLDSNMKAQVEKHTSKTASDHNEVRLFNNPADAVVGFIWAPLPKGMIPGPGATSNTSEWSTSKAQFQDYVDGMCNGPKDGKGSSAERYVPNPRDSFPVFRYEADGETGQAKLVLQEVIRPTSGRTFDPKTGRLG